MRDAFGHPGVAYPPMCARAAYTDPLLREFEMRRHARMFFFQKRDAFGGALMSPTDINMYPFLMKFAPFESRE